MRPGKPYPATFRSFQWTHPELNWDLRHARAASSPWTMSPCFPVDLMGVEPTTPTLQGSVAPNGMQARVTSADVLVRTSVSAVRAAALGQRSVRESNPILVLTKDVCCRNTYRPLFQ